MTTENKLIVQRAMAALVDSGDVGVLGAALSDGFVHHRPGSAPRSKAEWLADVRAAQEPMAGMRVEIGHVLSDADHVMVRSRRWLPGTGPEITVVDICRIENGLIAEVWETIEPTAQATANLTWWNPPAERPR